VHIEDTFSNSLIFKKLVKGLVENIFRIFILHRKNR
jgi:hypothetical protein